MLFARSLLSIVLLAPLAAQTSTTARLFEETNRALPETGTFVGRALLADLDGDGALDVLVPSTLGEHRLFRGDGNGAFVDASHRLPTGGNGVAAATADIDDDGDLDVVLAMSDGGFLQNGAQNQLWRNDGAAGFIDRTVQLPVAQDESRDVAFLDADGDGDFDLVFANRPYCSPIFGTCTGAQNTLYLNDGAGNFSDATAVRMPVDIDGTDALAVGDVDGNGAPDLLLVNIPLGFGAGQDRVYLNNGAGSFHEVVGLLPPDTDYGTDGLIADLDADGDQDLWIGNDGAPFRLFRNDGHLIADVSNQLPAATTFLAGGEAVDLTGDGLPELVLGGRGGTFPNLLFRNDGAMTFSDDSASLPARLPRAAPLVGDVDGDADVDLVLVPSVFAARLALNHGAGGLLDATSTSFPAPAGSTQVRTRALIAGDVNGDAEPDVVAVLFGAPYVQLLLGTPGGSLVDVTATHMPPGQANLRDAVLVDLDADGDLDLFVASSGSFFGTHMLLENDGAGVFSDVSLGAGLPAAGTSRVRAGDVDGDGAPDLVFTGFSMAKPLLFTNDGDLTFTDASAGIPTFSAGGTDLRLGDLNGDGFLDLLVGGFKLLINDGAGVFTDESSRLPAGSGLFLQALELGDVDADGDLDAFYATDSSGGFGAQSVLYTNDGLGNFTNASGQVASTSTSDLSALLFDADGDGDLDALTGGRGAPSFYVNDGTGVFADESARLPANVIETLTLAAADLDGDGDRDVLTGGDWVNAVWSNQTRHVGWSSLPRVARPIDLSVSGPPNGLYALAFSTGPASFPLPGFGRLRLEPTGLVVYQVGLLDAGGRKRVSIPPQSVAAGTSVVWQAAVGLPFRFTNASVTTLAAY